MVDDRECATRETMRMYVMGAIVWGFLSIVESVNGINTQLLARLKNCRAGKKIYCGHGFHFSAHLAFSGFSGPQVASNRQNWLKSVPQPALSY